MVAKEMQNFVHMSGLSFYGIPVKTMENQDEFYDAEDSAQTEEQKTNCINI